MWWVLWKQNSSVHIVTTITVIQHRQQGGWDSETVVSLHENLRLEQKENPPKVLLNVRWLGLQTLRDMLC